jgi:TIR domain-containing protein
MTAEFPGRPADDDADLTAPLFFFSYSHATEGQPDRRAKDRDEQAARFFEDLSEDVAELVSLPVGIEPGYIDRSIEGGAHWTPELLEAIGTCQVFVALFSVRYFKSRWCSMEWHAFSQRKIVGPPSLRMNHQTTILPVIWAGPIRPKRYPRTVSQVQRFTPRSLPDLSIAARYEQEGILGLLRTDPAAYRAVVWKLAQSIAWLHESYRVEPLVLEEHELGDGFADG